MFACGALYHFQGDTVASNQRDDQIRVAGRRLRPAQVLRAQALAKADGRRLEPAAAVRAHRRLAGGGKRLEMRAMATPRASWNPPCRPSRRTLVPGVGLEPTLLLGKGLLRPPCLPFHHPGRRLT